MGIWLFLLPHGAVGAQLGNQLNQHPSPYLALHGDDPVAWQEWNAETLARARRENKPLFVSVGYFACHWCHVMQRESYQNKEIAALLNRDFIPVKVDRELNTGLDDALQLFSERMTRVAGWPLNAVVTPDGYPFYVMLYAPPDEFREVMTRLSSRWKGESARIMKLAREAAIEAPPLRKQTLDRPAVQKLEALFLQQARSEWDELRGGFGEVSKFPMSPQLALLMDISADAKNRSLDGFLKLTLDQMSAKGLRDHVGGGFFRYTVDPGWETPHFEKMLYDNAQLAVLFLRAADVFKSSRYREVGLGALDFMLEELRDAEGGFYTSTSAVDVQGREGVYYLWEADALRNLLSTEEFSLVRRIWRLNAPRTFEHGYLPAEWENPSQAEHEMLASAIKKLKKARAKRSLPKDDKRNAGLNGLALMALTAAMKQHPQYARPAAELVRFIARRLVHQEGLYKAVSKNRKIAGAELEDYAYIVTGLQDYAEATGNREADRLANRLARQAWKLFYSEKGWRRESKPLLAVVQPEAILSDGATPSPSAMLIAASLRQRDAGLGRLARQAMQWQSPDMSRVPFSYPTQLRLYRSQID